MMNRSLKIAVLTLICLLIAPQIWAQDEDFGTQTGIDITKKILPGLNFTLGEEFRTRDNLKTADRWSTDLGLSYKVIPYLTLGGGYDFIRYNHATKGWETRNRYYFFATGQYKFSNFKLSLRERFQSTNRVGVKETDTRANPKLYLRHRLQLEYDIPDSKFSPFVSTELYETLNDPTGNSLNKLRYTAGCDYDINKRNSLELFYRYTNFKDDDDYSGRHVIGLGYSFKF
jgi:opacity protein-like surface antigen